MNTHSLPVRFGAHMGRAFLRWLELVINTTTVMLVTATVGAVLIFVGMALAGGPIDGGDFEQFFRDIVGSETKTTQIDTATPDDAPPPSTTHLAAPDDHPTLLLDFPETLPAVAGVQGINPTRVAVL